MVEKGTLTPSKWKVMKKVVEIKHKKYIKEFVQECIENNKDIEHDVIMKHIIKDIELNMKEEDEMYNINPSSYMMENGVRYQYTQNDVGEWIEYLTTIIRWVVK
jgi:hypothetical protein